ncbi:MAG: SRPBCC domain-containing protein, partial [Acidobacteria bacterium]|nr:SRPBCC domain-containing protein [Acidobacteriota bacterium]
LAGVVRTVEPAAGGGGRFLWSDQRGEVEARHWGRFLELERGRRIVFTWMVDESEEADPSKVTLTWTREGEGVVATVVHEMDAAWAEWAEQTKQGWSRMMRAADDLAAGGLPHE